MRTIRVTAMSMLAAFCTQQGVAQQLSFRNEALSPEARAVDCKRAPPIVQDWNEETDAWVVENEPVRLDVGASSADIRSSKTITLRSR